MLGKMKQWLGIEGVKVDFETALKYDKSETELEAALLINSITNQTIERIDIQLIEVYTRGKKDSKRIDEYVLGEKKISQAIYINKDEAKRIPFTISYTILETVMDEYQKNIFLKPLVSIAKWSRGVNSKYVLRAKLKVKGTKLNPFIEKEIKFS